MKGKTRKSGKPRRLSRNEKSHHHADLLEKTFNSVSDAIFLLDARNPSTILECNETATQIFGYPKAEMLGRTTDFLHVNEEALRGFQSKLYPAMEQSHLPYRLSEYKTKRKDGTVFPSEHIVSELVDDRGVRTGWVSVVRDITERKCMEEALREGGALFRGLFEGSRDAITINRVNGEFVDFNQAYVDLLGYARDELKQLKAHSIYGDPAERIKFQQQVDRNGYVKDYEVKLRRKDGSTVDCLITSVPWKADDGNILGYQGIIRDITERKRAQKTLRRSEERFRKLFQSNPIPLLITSLDGPIIDVNDAWMQLSGFSREEAIGRSTIELGMLLDPKERDLITKELLEKRRLSNIEMKRRTKTGEIRDVLNTLELVELNGQTCVLNMQVDITERKRVEDELRATRDRLEFLVSSTPVVIYTCKPYDDYAATFISQNVASQLGFTVEEFIKDPKFWVNHLHPEDRQRVLDGLSSLFKEGYQIHEYRLQHKDGTYRRMRDEMKLIRDGSGNPVEVVGYRIDVTRENLMEGGRRKYGLSVWKRAEHLEDAVEYRTRELIESEARYRILVENIPERIFAKDRNLVYVSCNNQYAQDLNIRPDQIRGKTDYDFFPRELADTYRAVDKRVMESGKTEEIEEKYIARDREFLIDTIRTPLRDSAGNVSGVLGIFRDITERKKMEARLAESQRLAAIGETAAMVAHDLRNPLQGIVGAAYNIREHLGNARDPSMDEMLAIIDNGVEYANGIISDLLEFSREIPLQPLSTTLRSIVRQALMDVKVPDNIRVEDTTADVPEILVDEAKIRRVLTNLIQNAIDAMPDGGRLSISSMNSPREVSIFVTDTGIGIPQDRMEKIWTALYTTKAKGIGLGLPICKRIVEAHDGSISVVSTVGRGSTFTVKLPIRPREGGERR